MIKIIHLENGYEFVVDLNRIYLENFAGNYYLCFYSKNESIRISQNDYNELKTILMRKK